MKMDIKEKSTAGIKVVTEAYMSYLHLQLSFAHNFIPPIYGRIGSVNPHQGGQK